MEIDPFLITLIKRYKLRLAALLAQDIKRGVLVILAKTAGYFGGPADLGLALVEYHVAQCCICPWLPQEIRKTPCEQL